MKVIKELPLVNFCLVAQDIKNVEVFEDKERQEYIFFCKKYVYITTRPFEVFNKLEKLKKAR